VRSGPVPGRWRLGPILGNRGASGSQMNAKIAPSGVDDVYVAYTHFDPATNDSDTRFEAVGPFGATSAVIGVSGAGNRADFADMALLTGGSLIVVWQDQTSIVMKLMLTNRIPLAQFRATGFWHLTLAEMK
jgi:hypothetical protein